MNTTKNQTTRVRNNRRHATAVLRSAIEPLEARTLLSTYTVNTISDAAAPGPGNLTLRQAITNANSHAGADTIAFSATVFKPGSLHTITLTRGQLLLADKSGATTIAGAGTAVLAISGGNVSRIFNIAAGVSATISGLAVINGQAPVDSIGTAQGGGIFNAGTLSLNSVNISQNSATGAPTQNRIGKPYGYAYGGGIYSTGPLHLQNSTVSGNSAVGGSGMQNPPTFNGHAYYGGWAFGGGIWCGAALTVSASTISDNQATGGYSGSNPWDYGPDNGGSASGGGITCSDLTLTNSTISGNTAEGSSIGGNGNHLGRSGSGSGGGISASGIVAITNSTLSGNQAIGANFPGDDHGAYAGDASGGALAGGSSVTIQSSIITQNQAIGGHNTAFGDGGSASGGGVNCGVLSVTASTISKNAATAGDGTSPAVPAPANGGGIYCGSLSITQCTVIGNTATSGGVRSGSQNYSGGSGGGGAFVEGAATIVQCTVSGNTVSGNVYQAPSSSVGGGLDVGGSLTLSSSTVSGNSAAGAGGEYGQGGGIWCGGSSLVATNSTIANNSASGGDFQSESSNGGPTIGGGIAATGNAKLYDCTVVGNTVSGSTSGQIASGGGLSVTTAALLNNSILSANKVNGAFNDIFGPVLKTSANNLIGAGGSLTNGMNGNKVGVTNPKLAALGNYGGPTQTMPPLIGSPAIDAGGNSLIPAGITADQRGFPRIVGGKVDIGAVEFSKIVISGAVYNDLNGDGVRQAGEPGMANVQVYVDLTNAGIFVAGDPVATTGALGNYVLTFAPLTVKGSLIIREVRPPTMRRTQPAGIYPLGFYTISSTAGAVSNINFGNSLTSLVTGTFYRDTNANGKLDSGEAGLFGWNVHASYVVNNVHIVKTILTDTKGNYSFVLPAGNYTITESVQRGFTRTKPGVAGYTLTLSTGATITGENFGNK